MRDYLKVFLCSFVVYWPQSLLRLISPQWSVIVGSISYAVLTYALINKYKTKSKWSLYLSILLGMVCIELPIRLYAYKSTSYTLVLSLCVLWAFITAILAKEIKNKYIAFIACAIWVFGVIDGVDRWMEYTRYGILSEKENINIANLKIKTDKGDITLSELSGEYVLLEFWKSDCVACQNDFQELQDAYDRFGKEASHVTIASVFDIQDKDDKERPWAKPEGLEIGQNIIVKHGFSFPVYGASRKDSIMKKTGVETFPTVIILDKSRNLIFRGSLMFAERELEELLGL